LSNYQVVHVDSVPMDQTVKTLVVSCPAGTLILGGGEAKSSTLIDFAAAEPGRGDGPEACARLRDRTRRAPRLVAA